MNPEIPRPLLIPKIMSKIYDQMSTLWGSYLTEDLEAGNNPSDLPATKEVCEAMTGLETALLNLVKETIESMEKAQVMEDEFRLASLVLVTPAKPKPPKPNRNLPF